ncbi:hypothetical protein UlMin_041344 [Ulmus minor]
MAASSSSSAAVEPRLPKHHVFLSFSGEDTRTKFTSHLYSALSEKYITFKDDVNLKIGDAISPALLEAIEESEISIIIFSENYASSSWCLDELLHILKCKKEKARTVLPIFIGIDPSHVRHQKETYAAAFEKHKERFKSEKLREWRQALKEAAGISGCVSGEKKSESEIVEEVVERVRRELDSIKSKRSDDFKGLFGISERLEKIKSFLDSQAVRVVGIWGMGGIGKTTLAKAVFSRFYYDFEGSCFAPNVRENARNKGLDTFKREVFSELLGEKNLNIFISDANDRLSRTKVLLVLDDVESPKQLEDLVGDRDRFCPGSKIIVTSRSKLRVDEEYEVEELNSNDACKLFYLNAFGHESCRRGFEEISDRVVKYTKGHPLALKLLGASVFYFLESIEDWVKELKKLKRIPNNEIRVSLERSYDALDDEEKELFLDIACFFRGEQRDIVVGILEDKPIAGLVRKSLITIEDDEIGMHDLIQEMGQDIVFKSTGKLGERSRLWNAQDVSYVLENNKGTEAIEGIYLPWNNEDVHLRPDVFEEMRKLRVLKFCDARHRSIAPLGIVNKVSIDGDLKYLPNGLRYLHWQCYPGKSLPSNFKPQFLVELNMPSSELEQLWDGVQKLGSLKHINLHGSELLTKIPDLSLAPKLESINLYGCRSLIHIPSLNFQATLDDLEERDYPSLLFENCEFERSPGSITLSCCERLTTLPKLCGNITMLSFGWTALKELPSSIESLENLLYLDLKHCANLKRLPKLPRNIKVLELRFSGIEEISSSLIECRCSLQILSLPNCSKLGSFSPQLLTGLCSLTNLGLTDCNTREIPYWLGSLTSLTELDLHCNAFEGIPASIGMLSKLENLRINDCKNLRSLPASIGMLYKLKDLYIIDCKNLRSLPASIGMLYKLSFLNISDCKNLRSLPASIGMLYKLKDLYIIDCKNLRSLPASIGMLYKLSFLNISDCKNLRSLPASIGMLYKLKDLYIIDCKNLRSLPASIGMLYKLSFLNISDCKNLRSLPASIGMLYKLKDLYIIDCKNLRSLPASIGMLYKLSFLNISDCKNLRSLPASIGMLYKLKDLYIIDCKNLRSLPASIGMLYKLSFLNISDCKNLRSLPASIGMLYKLKDLYIIDCKNLRSLPASIGMLYKLSFLNISDCKNLRSLPASIGMLYKLKYLYITGCKNLRSLPELPLFVVDVDVTGCSLLEMVSTLRSTLTLGRWLDHYDLSVYNGERRFSFLGCPNLGKDAINNIFTEFLYKVFCTATTPLEVVVSEVCDHTKFGIFYFYFSKAFEHIFTIIIFLTPICCTGTESNSSTCSSLFNKGNSKVVQQSL